MTTTTLTRHASTPSQLGSGLAREVHDARRERDLSVAALAARSRVTEADVRAAEDGEAVSAMVASELCATLGLNMRRHVPGLSNVLPSWRDQAQDARLRRIVDLMGKRPGMLAFPDEAVRAAKVPSVPAPWPQRLVRRVTGWPDVDRLTKVGIGAMLADALLGPRTLGLLTSSRDVVDMVQSVGFVIGLALVVLPPLLGLLAMALMAWARRGIPDLPKAYDGYLLEAAGLSGLSVGESRVVVRDTLARRVDAVDCEFHGGEHVSLRVHGDQGVVDLPWLPRTRDLSDAVAAWGVPVGTRP